MKRTRMIVGMLLAVMLVLSFTLTACGGTTPTTQAPGASNTPTTNNNSNPTTTTSKTDPTGTLTITVTPSELTIYAGEEVALLFGVEASDPAASLRISDDGDFDSETPGTYTITYEATLGDVTVNATRTIIVLNAKSDLAVEVTYNHLGDNKWPGKIMAFKNAQYFELSENTELSAQTGIFKNTSSEPIVLTVGGTYGCSAIVDANGVVLEGRDGANSKLVNAQSPSRAGSTVTTMVINGETVTVSSAFAKEMVIPAGGFAIIVQSNAFGSTSDTDGRGFMNYNVINNIGNVIRLFWVDTNEELTTYINQKPTVTGNNKILTLLGDASFDLNTAVLTGLVAKDDAGTFDLSDDIAIEEITLINDGGFNINEAGVYTITLSVTDGELTTEFTREVEVKSEGIGTLFIGENKMNVNMDLVAIDQNLSSNGKLAFIVYTYAYKAAGNTIDFANGWGIAFIMDAYGTIVRIYDGANAKYYDAEHLEGSKEGQCTSPGYLTEAFASLQEGEIMLVAPNYGDNNNAGGSRTFLNNNKVIGAKVSGLGIEFKSTNYTVTVGQNSMEIAKDLVAMDQQLDAVGDFAFIIYTYAFKQNGGTIGFTNGHGEAFVVNQYGQIVRIYDGANGKLYNTENPTGVTGIINGNNYDEEAFASLQEGETLIIAPHTTANSADGGSRKFFLSNRSFGAIFSGLGLQFEEKNTSLTVGSNTMDVAKELVIKDQQLDAVGEYAFIIYTYEFKKNGGTIGFTNGHGEAIVVNQYGEIVRIYDGANGKFYDAANPSGVTGIINGNNYDEEAFASLQEGETLIIAPHTTANSADGGSRKFLLSNRTFGAMVSGLGLTFEKKEN